MTRIDELSLLRDVEKRWREADAFLLGSETNDCYLSPGQFGSYRESVHKARAAQDALDSWRATQEES